MTQENTRDTSEYSRYRRTFKFLNVLCPAIFLNVIVLCKHVCCCFQVHI